MVRPTLPEPPATATVTILILVVGEDQKMVQGKSSNLAIGKMFNLELGIDVFCSLPRPPLLIHLSFDISWGCNLRRAERSKTIYKLGH